MSKKKTGGDGFNNRAARKFKDMQLRKIDTISQPEIYEILDDDMSTILTQISDFQERKPGAKYPKYISNMFANLSTAQYFYEYTVKLLRRKKKGKIDSKEAKREIKALKHIVADAYKKSATNQYPDQTQEFADRNKLLSKTFQLLDPKQFKLTAELDLKEKSQRRDLIIQVYGDPVHNMKFVHKLFNQSNLSDKKKLRLFKKLYGKRFVEAVGAAMTVDANSSDCIDMLYNHFNGMKTRKRAPYVRAFAEAYKQVKTRNYRIGEDFFEENKKLIKELKYLDIGYKKAFKTKKAPVKGKKDYKDSNPKPKTDWTKF